MQDSTKLKPPTPPPPSIPTAALHHCPALSFYQHCRFYEESSADRLAEELEFFGEGPPKGLKGAKRTKWFEDLAPEGVGSWG